MNLATPSPPCTAGLTGRASGTAGRAMPGIPRRRCRSNSFPPRTEALETQLWHCIRRLEPLAPRFVSVTYGAGGGTQERTHATVRRIVTETSLTPAAHLTCVAATRGEVDGIARGYWDAGVRHIVALRGDVPGGGAYEPHPRATSSPPPGGRAGARRAVRDLGRGLPEVHPTAPQSRRRPGQPQAQARCRRHPCHHQFPSSRPRYSCASSTAASLPG